MIYIIFSVVAIAALFWHRKLLAEKELELNIMCNQYANLLCMHSRYDFEETIKYFKEGYVDGMDLGKKEKKRAKKLSKLKLKFISKHLEDGAYSPENIAKGKYILSSEESENRRNEYAALSQLVSQAARISWTIADAASIDAANEGAVNIVDYQLESLISKYLNTFETRYEFDYIINCIRDGLNYTQVTHPMKERSYILFPKKYQDELFSIEDDELDNEKEMEKIYFELGGEKKFGAILNWGSLNLGKEDWEKFKTTYAKACDENDHETLKNLMLAIEQIQILKEKGE